jgi:hypothetical protein
MYVCVCVWLVGILVMSEQEFMGLVLARSWENG